MDRLVFPFEFIHGRLIKWFQNVREHPLGHVPPLLSRILISKTTMDAFVDAGVNNFLRGVREFATNSLDRDRIPI